MERALQRVSRSIPSFGLRQIYKNNFHCVMHYLKKTKTTTTYGSFICATCAHKMLIQTADDPTSQSKVFGSKL